MDITTPRGPRLAAAWLLTMALAPLTIAVPTPAAAAQLPCASGTPITGDLDGDGAADLLVGAANSASGVESYRWLSGSGGTGTWLDLQDARSADLNGDVCADLVAHLDHEDQLVLALGTPSGPDLDHPIRVQLPRSATLPDDVPLVFTYAAMRHDGVSQLVVVDMEDDGDGTYLDPVLDVVTLDATAHPASTRSIDLESLGATSEEYFPVVAEDGVVAVGAPSTEVGGQWGAGAVYVFTTDQAAAPALTFRTRITQNSPGVPDKAETGDWFGETLALRSGRLAIGATWEKVGSAASAGLVQPILWHGATNTFTAYRAITQSTRGVPGTSEKGDRFGEGLAIARGLTRSGSWDIVIGTPREDAGSRKDAGSVTVANFSASVYRGYTQATRKVPGSVEAGDLFGGGVAAVPGASGTDSLVIGAPGERTTGCATTGTVIRTAGGKLSSSTGWTSQPSPCDGRDHDLWGFRFGN